MSAVPQQVLTFLGESAPFDTLSDSDLGELARHASLIYLTQDNVAELIDKRATSLYLIANGQFTVHDCDGPVKHLSEGDIILGQINKAGMARKLAKVTVR